MSASNGDAFDGSGGILRGHGVAIAMVAIFAGMGLMFAYAASDGAIFGMNSSSIPYNNPPVANSNEGGPNVVSGDFDEQENADTSAPPESNVASTPESSNTLSDEERQLLAMSNYSWDSIAVKYISSSEDNTELFGQQNFTRQKPVDPGAEPLFMSDKIFVHVDHQSTSEGEVMNIETPVDTTTADGDEEAEEPQHDADEETNNSGSDDERQAEPITGGDSGSGDNDTSTNSTSTEGSSDSSNGNSTSDDSGIEASISIG